MSASSDPILTAPIRGVDAVRTHGRVGIDRMLPGLALVAAIGVALLCLLPTLVVISQAGSSGWANALKYLFRPRIGQLLGNTLLLVVTTVPLTLLLGTGAAWLVERTRLPGAGAWRVALLAPLAIPAFVASYAWSSFWPSMHGAPGAIMITTLAYFPFVFLPVAALLRVLDQADLDVARTLGVGPWRAVLRVALPQLRPALCGGGLLVALHLLAEFGVLEMMRFPTFTTAILQQYAIGFSTEAGNLLALVLIGLCALLLVTELVLRGRARIARVGPGAQQQPIRVALGHWTVPALAGLTVLVGAAVLLPVTMVIRWLIVAFQRNLVAGSALGWTTMTTLGLATAAGLAALVAAVPAAWLVQRRSSAQRRSRPLAIRRPSIRPPSIRHWAVATERAVFVASALPGVVIGLALVTLSVRWARPIYQTAALLVLAYLILFIPRALISWRAGLAATPPELSEAARTLGSGPLASARRVVLPLVAPSAGAGFVLVFLAAATELTATLLLSPTGTKTLATAFWAASDELDYAASAPYAAVMIALSAPLTWLLRRQIIAAGPKATSQE